MTVVLVSLISALSVALIWRYPKRNATGIFIAYVFSGAIVPYIVFALSGAEVGTVFPLDSREGDTAAFLVSTFLFLSLISVWFLSRALPQKICYKHAPSYGDANNQARVLAVLAIIAGLAYAFVMASLMGGLASFVERSYMRVRMEDSSANYSVVLFWGSFVCSIYAATLFNFRRASWTDRAIVIASFVIGLLLAASSGGRSVVVLYAFALLFGHIVRAKAFRIFLMAAIALISIFAVSEAMISTRYALQNISASSATGRSSAIERALTGLTFLDHVALSVHYSDDVGHDLGRSYAAALVTPVPRQLWIDKPLMLSTRMQQYRFGTSTGGVPPGLIGESYIAFGFIGVFIAAAFFGWILYSIDRRILYARSSGDRLCLAFGGVMAPLIGFALVRGGVDIGIMRVGIPLFWCLACEVIARRFLTQKRTGRNSLNAYRQVVT